MATKRVAENGPLSGETIGLSGPNDDSAHAASRGASVSSPTLSLPKGGGAIRGMGEKFAANPVTGTGSLSVPISVTPGRAGFGPQLSLGYDSAAGNGPFGFGWSLSIPSITRKTDKGLPRYHDADESDVFLLSGAEDLVPLLDADGSRSEDTSTAPEYVIHRYRPRVEGHFARIERWTRRSDDEHAGEMHWRSLSRDNVLTMYGKDENSRIADPTDPRRRIFSWLICESRDDKGNAILYEYKPEDGAGVDLTDAHECNRGALDDPRRQVNRYLKRIRYGNRVPLLDDTGHRPRLLTDLPNDQVQKTGWMFESVFDYGEHLDEAPTPRDVGEWTRRSDPFSVYRAGFEVRISRLCRRVLMFHHFKSEVGVGDDCLVRSTDFTYSHAKDLSDARNPVYSFLLAATQIGYKRNHGDYLQRSLPPVEFEYTQPVVSERVEDVDSESLENLPVGLDGAAYQWTDLHREGVPGILAEQGGAWFYKRNLSPTSVRPDDGSGSIEAAHLTARFAPVELVATMPNLSLASGQAQFRDLAGDGQPDLVVMDGPVPGLYEHDLNEGWLPFRPFTSHLNRDMRDPNLRFVDLDGDGRADVLITEDDAIVWHASLGEEGFGPAQRVYHAPDSEKGPRLVFADGTQSVYVADFSGDGLSDLVRIRNGEVCYWPNLGYGLFGAKVTMDHAPLFDQSDRFNQKRILVADIDGTGTTDIVYLHPDGVRLYFNQSGNSWSAAQALDVLPRLDDLASVVVVDLLGNGTACLVWSSPLATNPGPRMRYVNLMGGQKPHLLTRSVNNLGAETRVQYAPSTSFYVQDRQDGRPWITRLPFPVHVVERVETYDHVSGNRFVSRYAYHHGYFDGEEREFRGFGLVEQWDTEELAALRSGQQPRDGSNFDETSHVPPVLTRTWFHTGAYLGRDHVSDFFAGLWDDTDVGEYYREPDLSDAQAALLLLEDTILPTGLTSEEEREACRALKGSMLRQEIYALDGTDKAQHPYSVTEQNLTLRRVQPGAANRHAVFFTSPREAINYHYERDPSDPRISHLLTLRVDEFGNVLRSAAIGYGRRIADEALTEEDRAQQTRLFVTFSDNSFTNPIEQSDDYRAPLPSEARTYELTGLRLAEPETRFGFDAVVGAIDAAASITYHQQADPAQLQKRPIEDVRTQFRPNDLGASVGDPSALLPVNMLESLAIPGESYRLACTPELIQTLFGERVTADMLLSEGGYVDAAGDGDWWLPTGRVFLSPNADDTPAQELATARAHFFAPRRFRNSFGTESSVSPDAYDLLGVETRDPLGSMVTAVNDYRTLQARLVSDPNGNQSEVAFDALGLVVGTAVMGKSSEGLGDTLVGFEADLDDADALAHLTDPLADPHAILQGATSRLVYDLFAYARTQFEVQPQGAVVYSLVRETHHSELRAGESTRIQHAFSYSDGFSREIQHKVQAEPGPLTEGGTDIDPRWVGSGWIVFNNKGKPVRQFEPFFSDTHRFEFDVRRGVSPILCYDPLQRVVATLHPNHTWQKVVFDAWRQATWDVNDTALIPDPAHDADVGNYFARVALDDYLPTWYGQRSGGDLGGLELAAATQTAVHAETPALAHVDSLGRTFLTVAHNAFERGNSSAGPQREQRFQRTRIGLDIEGNQRELVDASERIVMRYDFDMLGTQVHSASMEAGERWSLEDVTGKPIRSWDSRGHAFRIEYDALRRPLRNFVIGGDVAQSDRRVLGHEVLFTKIEYGEGQADDIALNLRTRIFKLHDGAGIATSEAYDFKGNVLRGSRQLTRDYVGAPDWARDVALEEGSYTSSTTYDALNRATTATSADGSVIRPAFNAANLLERIDASLRGETLNGKAVWQPFVTHIAYNARGQRERIDYANGARTLYTYDPLTFRLIRLLTERNAAVFADDCPSFPRAGWPGCAAQNLTYFYDPVGNITHIQDDAQQTIYFRNRRVEPSADYTYDAVYQLVGATGREHLSPTDGVPTAPDAFDASYTNLVHPGDGRAMEPYRESYVYDVVGNILQMIHRATGGGWTRAYAFAEPSLIEPGKVNNRLSSTHVADGQLERYSYDPHGSMTRMPHLPLMQCTFLDQLRASSQQVVNGGTPETTYYVYDAAGTRVRKVTERRAAADDAPTRKTERVYQGGLEIYREYAGDGTAIDLERETLHVLDHKQRVAMVETRTRGDDDTAARLIRYQFGNHLGSASLELDETGNAISYEEYFPFGSTSYQAVDASIKAAAKRYRYTAMERDEETSLAYHGARQYAPWLGRWVSADPLRVRDGPNLFSYVRNSPTIGVDRRGTETFAPFLVGQTLGQIRDSAYTDFPEDERPTAFLNLSVTDNLTRIATGAFIVIVGGAAGSVSQVANAPTSEETRLQNNPGAGLYSILMVGGAIGSARGAVTMWGSRNVDALELLAVQDLHAEELSGVWSRSGRQIRESERTVELLEPEVIPMPEASVEELKRGLPSQRTDTTRVYRGAAFAEEKQVGLRWRDNPESAPEGDEMFMSAYEADLHRITPKNLEFGEAHSPGVSVSTDLGTSLEEFTKVNPFGNAKLKGVIVYDVPNPLFERLPRGDIGQVERVFYGSIPESTRVDVIRVIAFPRPYPTNP